MIIFINSSKTMQNAATPQQGSLPVLINLASVLHGKIIKASRPAIIRGMHVSKQLADSVIANAQVWQPQGTTLALYAFQGDIYQGLQAKTFSQADIAFASEHLRILSGLYGILRPLDVISPYRLEIGYGFPTNLYTFWGDSIASHIKSKLIINLASAEYAKAVLPYLKGANIIEPQFLVQYPGEEPKFAAYHAKIARGAFAAWLISTSNSTATNLEEFAENGYAFNDGLSRYNAPVFVLKTTKK